MTTQADIELQKKLLDGEVGDVDTIWISKPCKGFTSTNLRRRRDAVALKTFSIGGCLCKCALITFALLSLMTLLALGGVYFWMKDVVQHLTVTDSRDFPVVEMNDAQLDLLGSRVKVFFDQLVLGEEPAQDLVVTQDEINGALGHSDYLRGHMYVTLTEDHVLEEYSLPMDMAPGGKGRFFLGHDYTHIDESQHLVELKMETAAKHEDWFVGPLYFLQLHFEGKDFDEYDHQHLLELFIENGSFFGNAIPDDFINQRKNLLEDAYADPDSGKDFRAIIHGIESIKVEEGRFVVKPRRSNDADESEGVRADTNEEQDEIIELIEEYDEEEVEDSAPKDSAENVVTSSSMLRATKVEPARPKQSVVMTHLRTPNGSP